MELVWGLLVRSRVELRRWGENRVPCLRAKITLPCSKRYWNQITRERTLYQQRCWNVIRVLSVKDVPEYMFHGIFPLSADKNPTESPLSPPETRPVISVGRLEGIFVQKHACQLWDERHHFLPPLLLLAAQRGYLMPTGGNDGDYKQAILDWYHYTDSSFLVWPAKHFWHPPSVYFANLLPLPGSVAPSSGNHHVLVSTITPAMHLIDLSKPRNVKVVRMPLYHSWFSVSVSFMDWESSKIKQMSPVLLIASAFCTVHIRLQKRLIDPRGKNQALPRITLLPKY